MSAAKHTPGPWKLIRLVTTGSVVEVKGPNNELIASLASGTALRGGWIEGDDNGHLITAAPDLLAAAVEALEAINSSAAMSYGDVKALERDDRRAWVRAVKQLSAAIAKTRGAQ